MSLFTYFNRRSGYRSTQKRGRGQTLYAGHLGKAPISETFEKASQTSQPASSNALLKDIKTF